MHAIMFSLVLLNLFFSAYALPNSPTLCVDIGGTRIKAAVLEPNMSLEDLKKATVVTCLSQPWLNTRLPTLFDSNTSESLASLISQTYTSISCGITGPVVNSRLYINPGKFTIPRELAACCEEYAHVPVRLENDTMVWSLGALYWLRLTNTPVQFPCLCITLGTGAGIALLRSSTDITLIEISFLDSPFKYLFACCDEQPVNIEFGRKSPHEPIGESFFKWTRSQTSWNEEIMQIKFNDRVIAMCRDLEAFITEKFNTQLQSILIGGGNSRFIVSKELSVILNRKVIVLSPEHVSRTGISPDIISLLGCVVPREGISIQCIPPISDDHV